MLTTQYHHVTLTPQKDKIDQTRQLLIECAQKVAAFKNKNGPTSWCAIFDEEKQVFSVEALFPSQEAVKFHQENIGVIVKQFATLMAAPPQTIIKDVFVVA